MNEMRSTVMRLERQIAFDNAQALHALRQGYESLAEAILRMARDRGYVGNDPLGALGHVFAPSPRDRTLAEAAGELWRTFFACFRSDEAQFEAQRFAEQAAPVQQRLDALPEGGWPDARLVTDILSVLSVFWMERHDAINQRLDILIKDLGEHQSKLGGAQMQSAHQADELQRALGVLEGALRELGEPLPEQPGPAQLLGILVARYRRELTERQSQLERVGSAHRGLAQAIVSAARRESLPELIGADALAAKAVAQLAEDRARFMDEVRTLRAESARLQAEQRQLMEEVDDRDRRIARFELGDRPEADQDARLDLYRKAFAAWQTGADPKQLIDKIRELERIIVFAPGDESQALKVLDRQGAELVKCLAELRAIRAVAADPKRLRPRLLLGSRYDFKTIGGHAQALRDAARDLLAYVSQARWATGVALLSKEAGRLQRIFKEMVSLVALWRDKLGDPPGASMSVRIEMGSSIVALPALLATDIEAITRRKGAKATQAAADIVPVLMECVAMYRKSLEKARGEALPAQDQIPKRESDLSRLTRLAQELTGLGGVLEAAFSEAIATDFRLEPADQALIQADHVVLLALQQLDVACDVLAVLPGAPEAKLGSLPSGRGSLDKLLTAAKVRASWLEDVARYRFERRDPAA